VPDLPVPSGLSPDAEDLFRDVSRERAESMTPERHAALLQACRLVAMADRAEGAMGSDLIVTGYKGQPVPNGLLSEVRLARSAAVDALKAAGLGPVQSSASAAGSALARKRHSSGSHLSAV
jgi:hypothetical protein